jgi:hypothetical protein
MLPGVSRDVASGQLAASTAARQLLQASATAVLTSHTEPAKGASQ